MASSVCSTRRRSTRGGQLPVAFGAPPGVFHEDGVVELVARMRKTLDRTLRILRVKGDGRCMFRSIARNLAVFRQKNLPENLERDDADFLREAAYKVICVEKRNEYSRKGIIEGDMGSYCSRMRRPDFYGGEPEMYVLSEILKQPIGVYLEVARGQFQKIVEYGKPYAKKPEIRLLYNGTNHYDALVAN